MNFFNEINAIFFYLHSIRKLESYISLDVKFPSKWAIPKNLVDESKVIELECKDTDYRFFSFISEFKEEFLFKTMEMIKSIIKLNIEREEKEKLFTIKIKELKVLFEKSGLESLKQLKFDVNADGLNTEIGDLATETT